MLTPTRACPFVARDCLQDGCLGWLQGDCHLIPRPQSESAFEQKVRMAAPLMYRTLLDLVRVMEEASENCKRCGPELWNHAQDLRTSLLDELIRAELAESGIRADDGRG
jgi:hypothetical protein